jgi:hypothetical protein
MSTLGSNHNYITPWRQGFTPPKKIFLAVKLDITDEVRWKITALRARCQRQNFKSLQYFFLAKNIAAAFDYSTDVLVREHKFILSCASCCTAERSPRCKKFAAWKESNPALIDNENRTHKRLAERRKN